MSPSRQWTAGFCVLFVCGGAGAGEELARKHLPWDTCFVVEGKASDCGAGNRPRPFKEFLSPGQWAQEPQDAFWSEFKWDLSQGEGNALAVVWREIGGFGAHRIRDVRYSHGRGDFAGVILVESSPGIFSPLMKWSGRMPQAAIYRVGQSTVLVIEKDFGGNVPMVDTWAWVWGPIGPVRLDVHGAVHEAIQKVAPGHTGYDTRLDWKTLLCRTWTWPEGRYPGKTGVGESVDAWFKLVGTQLVVERVEFRLQFQADAEERHWP